MTPLFHPLLVNGPLGDPVVFIDLKFSRRAFLFDLGEIRSLPPRKILKITHVFISHTHLDHFVGFDHLLRICLGRNKQIHLFGPPKFLDQIKHKLSGYTWNLVESYPYSLELMVGEVHPHQIVFTRLSSSTAFNEETRIEIKPFDGLVYEEPSFQVRAAFLDHKIPCLAFSLEERSHLNILKTGLEQMALIKGPWLRELKEAIWKNEKDDYLIQVNFSTNKERPNPFVSLGTLKKSLVRITSGQKIAYVTDTICNETTQNIIRELVGGSDTLFMESAFLEEDIQQAKEKYHLTARQAGMIAAEAGVKRLIPFHISPKYSANPDWVTQEALQAFHNPVEKKNLSIEN
jgi:ribonuclease Z